MAPLRHDPAERRRRQENRLSRLERRLAVGSVLGFGAVLGLVAEHAVGSAKHTARPAAAVSRTSAASTTFFDETDGGYAFDDSGATASSSSAPASSSSQAQSAAPPPVAQSSAS